MSSQIKRIALCAVAAATLVFSFSSAAMAQRGGHGGHGHGGHGGGHHGGGHHGGGHHGGGHGGHHHHGGGYYGGGFGISIGPRYGYGYGYSPSYGYGGYGNYYNDYGYSYAPSRVYVARPVITAPANVATVEVRLPDAQGEYWLQGQKQGGTGAVRTFRSPALEPGRNFVYTVTAAWHENGQLVSEERKVTVQANGSFLVDFTQADPAAAAADPRPAGAEGLPPTPRP